MGISEIEQEEIAQLCQVEGEGMMAIWATQMVLLISLGTTICYENAGHGTVSGGSPAIVSFLNFVWGEEASAPQVSRYHIPSPGVVGKPLQGN